MARSDFYILQWKELRNLVACSVHEFEEYHVELKEQLRKCNERIATLRKDKTPEGERSLFRTKRFLRELETGLQLCNRIVTELGLDAETRHEQAILKLARIVDAFFGDIPLEVMRPERLELTKLIKELEHGK